MDKITIVTVTFNCRDVIEKTIKSVLSQDYANIEYIIIDGNSQDGTKDIINKYIENIDTFVSEKDKGIYDAMNKGLERATGEWIFFLNAADIFYNNSVLSVVAKEIDRDVDVIWGNYQTKSDNKLISRICDEPFFKNTKKYHGMGFSHQSVFVRTEKAKKLMFDLSYKCCADYNMMVQLFDQGAKFKYCNAFIAIVEGFNGFSYENLSTQIKDTAKILGIDKSLYFKYIYLKWQTKKFIKRIINRK